MTTTDYQRALAGEPALRAIEAAVDALCTLVRPGDTLCCGCVWEGIVKPLSLPLVGWCRGYPRERAPDPEPGTTMRVRTAADLSAVADRRVPATTETEAWLRTAAAYDAVTDEWIARLHKADPGNGHGMAKGRR